MSTTALLGMMSDTVPGVEITSTEIKDDLPQEVPGLSRICRLVESALALREASAVTREIAERLPAILSESRGAFPAALRRPDPDGYRRIELHHCPVSGYQILLMVWGPGQSTRIHDHGDTWGVEAVWLGALRVAAFRETESREGLVRLVPADSTDLATGDVTTVTPEHQLHLCRNPSTRDVAVTLHIYGAALDECVEFHNAESDWYEPRIVALRSE